MAYPDFKVGAQPIMTQQPTRVRFIPAQPTFTQLSGGGTVASVRSDGARVVATWSVSAAESGAYAELVADINAENGVLTLTWEDPDAEAFSVAVVAEGVPQTAGPGKFHDSFTVTFRETPSKWVFLLEVK